MDNFIKEISECFMLPKKCYHERKCRGYYCRLIGGQRCVHAVITSDGKLKAMSGQDLFKFVDKNHPQYDHLYQLYDENHLNELRQVQLEQDKKDRELYAKQLNDEKLGREKRLQLEQESYFNAAQQTSEMRIHHTPI